MEDHKVVFRVAHSNLFVQEEEEVTLEMKIQNADTAKIIAADILTQHVTAPCAEGRSSWEMVLAQM